MPTAAQPGPAQSGPAQSGPAQPESAQPEPQPQPQARRSRWMLGVTGVVLLVVAIVMMASNAPASKAQTFRPGPAPTQLTQLQPPPPAGPHPNTISTR